jgi:hypothetical protein
LAFLRKSTILRKSAILRKLAFLQKSAFFAKNTYKFFCKKLRFFAKIGVFAKISDIAKIGGFCKIGVFAKIGVFLQKKSGKKIFVKRKNCKNREKSFLRNPIFGIGSGEFRKNPIGFLRKSCFSTRNPIFAKKKICKHFCNVVRYIPMG